MTAIAYPYFRPGNDTVTVTAWLPTLDGEACMIVEDHLEHFDYSTRLTVCRHFAVDVARVAADVGLEAKDLRLLCVVSAGTGGGRFQRARQVVLRAEINAACDVVDIELAIEGTEVSQLLNLTTELVLLSAGTARKRLSPTSPGARLWRDDFRIMVEPTGARFPMEAVSFAAALPNCSGDALWFLDWSPQDLDQDFVSSVRLYINQDKPAFVEAVQRAESVTLRMLFCSVATQMIRSAVGLEHFPPEPADTLQASVGSVIESWIEQAFPGHTPGSVRTLAGNDPAHFELAIGGLFARELTDE